jgi:hypothetical protein
VANVAESLITDMQTIKHLVRSNRRLAIRNKITECERILKQNMVGLEQIRSVLQDAKDRAFQEITRHSPNGIPTRTAEFYQEVFEELSARIPTFIQELKDGTFQINLFLPGSPLPHATKGGFHSEQAAERWRDSDLGTSIIKSILAKQ